MFEITYDDKEKLAFFTGVGKAPEKARYDFTFENRYLIYHTQEKTEMRYSALDMKTGLASFVCRPKQPVAKELHMSLIPKILNSIKYTGDTRYRNPLVQNPEELIDTIFRSIMPHYGYAVREEQVKLAHTMYEGLTNARVSLCEAEVGTGKTMAYLVASFLAKRSGKLDAAGKQPITISTSSIELQKSIVQREIPMLSQMLLDYGIIDRPITVALRKGKEHYFCLARYLDYTEKLNQYPQKNALLLDYFQKTNFEHHAFDLDREKIPPVVKGRICVKGSCAGCPHKIQCKYHGYMNAASKSSKLDFQVTNHNQYLTHLRLQAEDTGGILQTSSYVVVDEAHKLKDTAMDVLGERLEEDEIPKYCNSVRHLCAVPEFQSKYRRTLDELEALTGELFQVLRNMKNREDLDRSMVSLPLGAFMKLCQIVRKIETIEELRTPKKKQYEISGGSVLNKFRPFLQPSELNIWPEEDDGGKISLCGVQKDLPRLMAERIWRNNTNHLLTSGTMSDGKNFDFFKKENGIHYISPTLVRQSMTASPFDFQHHTRLYIPKKMPIPKNDSPEYLQAVADQVVHLVNATNGHTAVLFTSYKVLQKVYELTAPSLKQYDLICMSRSNKTAISQFRKSKNAVLFAAGSMWEGVDCVGDCLSSVIIVRLPFPPRSAVMEQKKVQSESVADFIDAYAVPEMIIKLRQGCGRLVRSENDTGVISILDSRVTQSRYSQKVLEALKKYPRVNSIQEVEGFMRRIKPESYFQL